MSEYYEGRWVLTIFGNYIWVGNYKWWTINYYREHWGPDVLLENEDGSFNTNYWQEERDRPKQRKAPK